MPRKKNITKRKSNHIKQNTTSIPKQKKTAASKLKSIKRTPKERPLTPKQLQFTREYLTNGFNITAAAIKAGYSEKSASVTGSKLLRKANIQKYISEQAKKAEKKYDTSLENIQREAAKIAFGNMKDFYDKEGELIPVHELDREISATISELEYKELYSVDGGNFGKLTKIKKSDKLKALNFLKTFHASETKKFKHEVTGVDGQPVIEKPIVKLYLPDNKRLYDTE